MKPPFAYFGGKTNLADRIAALLPPHQHYVEPYCGSLSVLLAKPLSKMETVNDLDHELMTFWRVLRERPEDLARVCALTPHSRAEHIASRNRDVDDDLEVARRVWILLSQGRGLTLREGRTGWKHYVCPRTSSLGMPGYLDAYVDRMAAAAERLHAVSLECMPALDLIAKYGAEPTVLLYVDPPYLGTTRDHRNNYRHEMKSDAEHRALAESLNAAAAAVVLSGYASDLYDRELYAGWDRVTLPAFTGNSSGDGSRVEVLWSNRPLGGQSRLFDGMESLMSRTIKTVNRPAPHVFDSDPDVPADWQGRHFCRAVVASTQDHGGLRRCALRESDSVHVTREDMAASLPPVPPEAQEIDARILGEA